MAAMSVDKPLFVVNPRSGGGRTGKLFDAARRPIERALGEVDVAFTERGRHAVDLAREAALAGRRTVVAVGGDGSIHEVVNGLMQAKAAGASGTRLGVVGMGTGGDFRKTLGLEHKLEHYLAAIAAGRTRVVDVGHFSYAGHDGAAKEAHFVNILSIGVGGLVDRYVAETTKAFGGTFAYYVASLRAVVESVAARIQVTVEDDAGTRTETRVSRSLAICNGQYFGSGMHVAPMAKPDDGLFECVDLGSADRLPFLLSSSDMYSAKHLRNKGVSHFRARKITVEALDAKVAHKLELDVDGEPLGRAPITIEVVPRAIEVLVP
jgi:YegS/Rv2252/BmrU family lipid kinase